MDNILKFLFAMILKSSFLMPGAVVIVCIIDWRSMYSQMDCFLIMSSSFQFTNRFLISFYSQIIRVTICTCFMVMYA
jgi:hypothetical protein